MTIHLRTLDAEAKVSLRQAISLPHGLSDLYAFHLKRVFDLLIVLICAPVVLPFLLVTMMVVALDGHSPIYRQKRIGRGGRVYSILKIRTMVPNAEGLLERHLAENAEARAEWDELQKLHCDPRITPFGRILRKTSLDELPQLWNVVRGDMSIVGPRPMMVSQQPLYPGAAYYQMRPGVTGPWQVSQRNFSSFVDRAMYDDDYYRSCSLSEDLRLLARTVTVVLRGTGV